MIETMNRLKRAYLMTRFAWGLSRADRIIGAARILRFGTGLPVITPTDASACWNVSNGRTLVTLHSLRSVRVVRSEAV